MRRLLILMLLTALVPQLLWADVEYGLTVYMMNGHAVTVTLERGGAHDGLNRGTSLFRF